MILDGRGDWEVERVMFVVKYWVLALHILPPWPGVGWQPDI
jgi:hypothetical protein